MKTVSLIFAALAALLITGCGTPHVPKTQLSVDTDKWQFTLRSEKDTDLNKLNVNLATNGAVVVSLDRFTATNSPAVIKETGKAQALTIDAQGNLLDKTGNIVGKIVDGVATIYGK